MHGGLDLRPGIPRPGNSVPWEIAGWRNQHGRSNRALNLKSRGWKRTRSLGTCRIVPVPCWYPQKISKHWVIFLSNAEGNRDRIRPPWSIALPGRILQAARWGLLGPARLRVRRIICKTCSRHRTSDIWRRWSEWKYTRDIAFHCRSSSIQRQLCWIQRATIRYSWGFHNWRGWRWNPTKDS